MTLPVHVPVPVPVHETCYPSDDPEKTLHETPWGPRRVFRARARARARVRVATREARWLRSNSPQLREHLTLERIRVTRLARVVFLVGSLELVLVVGLHKLRERLLVAAREQLLPPLMTRVAEERASAFGSKTLHEVRPHRRRHVLVVRRRFEIARQVATRAIRHAERLHEKRHELALVRQGDRREIAGLAGVD